MPVIAVTVLFLEPKGQYFYNSRYKLHLYFICCAIGNY
jgi:hypothetical protein